MKEGVGRAIGVDSARSLSRVLRRDRGRVSPVERMKGILDSSPPALEELRFRPGAAGRAEMGEEASELGLGCVGRSMAV